MRKYINYLLILCLVSTCTSATEPESEILEISTSTSSTSTTSITTTVQNNDEDIVVDKYGIELLVASPDMIEQFNELIAFVEKRTPNFSDKPSQNMPDFYPWWNTEKYEKDLE